MKKIISLFLAVMFCFGLAITAHAIEEPEVVVTTSYMPPGSRSIIGIDNRSTIVGNLRKTAPYSAIGRLYLEFEDGCTAYGTGYMVSENCMMTAGHCFFCENHDSPLETLTAYFGYISSSNYLKKAVATAGEEVMVHDANYTGYSGEARYDNGYVVFSENVGNTTGWFGLMAPSNSILMEHDAYITGYQVDVMKTHSNTIESMTTYTLQYQIDTEGGQSGSPVYWYDNTYGYIVVGTHVKGTNNTTSGYNTAWRVTSSFINTLDGLGYIDRIT